MPRWLVWSLVAIALWGSWLLLGKLTGLDAFFLTALSAIGVVAVAAPLLLSPNLRKGDNLRRGMAMAFLTGLLGNTGNLTQLMAMKMGEASVVGPYTSIYPLVTLVVAFVVLKERLNRVQGAGLLLALGAIVLFGYVTSGADPAAQKGPWMLWASVTVACFGLAAVTQKIATNHISNELSLVCFAASFIPASVIILSCFGPFSWTLPPKEWVYALLYGAGIGLGTLTLFAAYRHGNASVVTALTGLYPALTVVLVVAIPRFKESLTDERFGFLKPAAIVLALAAGTALTFEGKKAGA